MNKAKLIWVGGTMILLEALLPVPGPLTFLCLYVLLVKPRWFKDAVNDLYEA